MVKRAEAALKKRAPAKAGPKELKRQSKVAETAYFLAEKRGFTPGGELHDWFLAEEIVDAELPRPPKGRSDA